MFWVCNHIVIWYLSAKNGQCVTNLFVVLPIRILSFSTNVYIFRNFSYRILRVFFLHKFIEVCMKSWISTGIYSDTHMPLCGVFMLSFEKYFFRKTNCLWSSFRRLHKNFLLCTLIVSSMSAYSVSEEFAIVTILSSGMSPPSP